MKKVKQEMAKMMQDKYHFGATIIRYAFGFLFILVAVKKFRMGYSGFAEGLVGADDLLAKEIPNGLLYVYGLIIPGLELAVGLMLVANKWVKEAYFLAAAMYISFIFGQMYNGNTSKIGTEYLPSLAVLVLGFFLYAEGMMHGHLKERN